MNKLKQTLSNLLVIPLVALGTVACEMDGIEEPVLSQESAMDTNEAGVSDESGANLRLGNNIIFEETFEGKDPFGTANGLELGAKHSLTFVAKPGEPNGKAARFELRDNDPTVKGSTRTEVSIVKGEEGHIGKDTWYAFDLYVPTDYKDEDNKELITQWHQDGPTAGLNIKSGRFFWRFFIDGDMWDYDLGAIQKGQWHNVVIHMLHSRGSDGITELWFNGKKLLDLTGRNINDDHLPKWKLGIYKSTWHSKKTTVSKRVLYYDNIKVGNKDATYEEMRNDATGSPSASPDAKPDPTPEVKPKPVPDVKPTPTKPGVDLSDSPSGTGIESLTFVNAQDETDIYALTDGRSLSLSEQGTYKINVRADLRKSVGSVKFELSGAQRYTYSDNAKPYALFGDDSKGNYYYGPGMTPGKYTLKITSYTEEKGKGSVIGSQVVNFTITK